MTVTLDYTIGLLKRRKFRKMLDDRGLEYSEGQGVIDRGFFVEAEIEEHMELSKEIYSA